MKSSLLFILKSHVGKFHPKDFSEMRKEEGERRWKLLHDVNFQAVEFCFIFCFERFQSNLPWCYKATPTNNCSKLKVISATQDSVVLQSLSDNCWLISQLSLWMLSSSRYYHYYCSVMTICYLLYNNYCGETDYCASYIIYPKQTAWKFQMFQWFAFRDF